jgi:type II secretory pathway component PulF
MENNPYAKTPAASLTNAGPQQRVSRSMIALVISWLLLGLLCVAIQSVIPQFGEVFSSFGADLPKLTQLVQAYHEAALLLPVVPILAYFFWPRRARRVRAALILCWLSMLPVVGMMVAMYLPIFRLGAVV